MKLNLRFSNSAYLFMDVHRSVASLSVLPSFFRFYPTSKVAHTEVS